MILLAIFLPPVAMALKGRIVQAFLCLALMLTLLGWPFAALWAISVVNGANADARMRRIERRIEHAVTNGSHRG